jgi:drug/metabolite transporter (DMT)-like permease
MSSTVFIAVIFAAIIHSIWNGMIKKQDDKYIALAAIVLGHVPLSIIVLFFTPIISIKSIPYIFISAIFLAGYEWCLLSAYRLEDYTKIYPIARGSAPIFIVIFSLLFFNINISKFELMGIFAISLGIIILGFQNFKIIKNYSAIFYAIATGFFISCYSITDGFGGRTSFSPINYTAWLMIFNAMVTFPILLIIMKKTEALKEVFTKGKKIFLVGGPLSYTAYTIVVWAFTHAPVPLVAALRETSIIFAILIGSLFLKEKLTLIKISSIFVIFIGVLSLKLF